ncbi:MAG: CDP-alcohol phosphatidyltransferase family protein [Ignavibacteriaceae bacterium]|nr:CDP-alcohol phosphatidyltransferase family protein [Ignavibacteriaceae bacterium]
MLKLKEINTTSNYLSIIRLFLAVPFWIMLDHFDHPDFRYMLFALTLFASLTDIMDGYLARKMNQITEFGKIIDPLADKVCIAVIITKLYLIHLIPSYYFFMIIGRDILIFLGGILLTTKLGRVLPSNMLGKITVLIIGIVIILIFLQVDQASFYFKAIYGISILLIIVSFTAYLLRASEFLKAKPSNDISGSTKSTSVNKGK